MTTNPATQHKAIDADLSTIVGVDFEAVARRLHAVVDSTTGANNLRPWEDGANVDPDGFSARASGSDSGGSKSADTTSSVERVAAARLRHSDPTGDLVAAALVHLANAARSARSIDVVLAKIAATYGDVANAGPVVGCWALDRVGGWEPVHATIVIDAQSYALGRWAYDYHRRQGTLPTLAQCRAHVGGRRVFVSA